MFKAGSKARVVREAYSKGLPDSPLPIGPGDVVTVRDDGIDPDGDVSCYTEAGKAIWPAASCLEPVEDETTASTPPEGLSLADLSQAERKRAVTLGIAKELLPHASQNTASLLRLARYIETGTTDA